MTSRKAVAVKRLLGLPPTLLAAATMVFVVLHVVPGDPVEAMLGEMAQPADVAELRHELGLDRPLPSQYARFLAGLLRGDLGTSLAYHAPVAGIVAARYPATLELSAAALAVALVVAIPLGLLAAARPGTAVDHLSTGAALAGVCLPNFASGPLFILVFSIWLGWLPVSGRGGPSHLVLPALTLGLGMAGVLTRMTRATVLDALGEDYVRTARAKGASELRVFAAHALRNALNPLLTLVGLELGALLAGTVITETIFSWPGVGRLLIQAIAARDYPLVEGCVLAITASYVVVNAATDILYTVADPRLATSR